MEIRPACRSDLEKVAAIHIASWKDAYGDILPAEFLNGRIDRVLGRHWHEMAIQKEDVLLVAEEKAIIGFIAVWCRPVPFLDNLHVTASQRSKKVGSALMEAAATELIARGHRTAYLWVFETNSDAIRFYERLGGIQKEKAMKSVFGHEVMSLKIEWNDLTVICGKQSITDIE